MFTSTRFFIITSIIPAVVVISAYTGYSQTNPTAQSLPYSQDFSGLTHASTTYPSGIQGWELATTATSTFRVNSPTADRSLVASSSASTTSGNVHNFNGKIGFLPTGSLDPSICLAISTTGLSSIIVSYDVMTIRNTYDGSSNTRINEVTLQYRIGTSGNFTTLAGMEYENNTTAQNTGTTPQNLVTKNITLPSGCNNASEVQIRWVQRDKTGSGTRPSFAIDNISISGNASTDIFINTDNTAVTENFNNFLSPANTLPTGWTASFASTANYGTAPNTGSSTTGAVYAYGTVTGEYALGALRSGSTGNITITATFRNNTGGTIRNLVIAYDFEQWRYSNTSGFSVSTSGTGTGSVSVLNQNGVASGTNGTVSTTAKSLTLTGLNISNNSTFTISWLAADGGGGGNNGIAIDNFSIKANVPLAASYFRSAASGSWQSTSTWEVSPDNSSWSAASYVPASYANIITVGNGHVVDIFDNVDMDQVVIEAGGELVRKPNVQFTVNNGSGDDITVYGNLKFQSTIAPDNYSSAISFGSSSKILVKGDGMIEANFSGASGYEDLAVQSVTDGNIEYETEAIYNWNPTTNTSSPTSGVTYFPGVSTSVSPVFRLSRTLSFGIGGASPTVINGVFESTVDVTWNGTGTKTFRNGIRNSASTTITQNSGQFIISGTLAEIGGAGTLALNTNGLSIPGGAEVTLANNKNINSGPISIAGTFDLDEYALSGSYTTFSLSGTATVKTAHVNGLRSATGALQGAVPSYNFNVAGTTVEYNRLGAQTVTNNAYYNLTFRGNGDKTLAGNTVVNHNIAWFDLQGIPQLKCGSFTLEVRGNWDNESADDFDAETGTVYMGLASNTRSINSENNFNVLRILGTVNLFATQNILGHVEVPTGSILNTNGNLSIESGASLLHGVNTPSGGGTVNGDVMVKRTGNTGGYAYNYWSAPVSGESVDVLGSNLYYYDPTQAGDTSTGGLRQGWKAASGMMSPGTGYISTNGGTVTFTGTANDASNGVSETPITVDIKKNVGSSNNVSWNLVGNPFPCGLDANLFMDENGPVTGNTDSVIKGGLYFWDDDNSGGAGWATNDYAVWTKAGSVPGSPAASNSGNSPDGYIASGQSFFVSKIDNGTNQVVFRNSMRTTSNNVFFRQKPIERFWVNISNPDSEINETLIAFIEDATDGVDLLYDAEKLKGNDRMSVYTRINGGIFAIQALPSLTDDRVIEVGFDAGTPGTHTFRLSYSENLDQTVLLILEDRLLNHFHNLNENPEYQFHADAETNVSRFFIHINPALQITPVDASCAGADGEISLFQPGSKTWDYTIYNPSNQVLASGNSFNGSVSFTGLNAGLYRIDLTDVRGFSLSKDIILSGKTPVIAQFTPDVTVASTNQTISFANNTTGATGYEWDFGDGAVSTDTVPQHAYASEGNYTVTLKAYNDDCLHSISQEVVVYNVAVGIGGHYRDQTIVTSNGESILVRFDFEREVPVEISVCNLLGQSIYQSLATTKGDVRIYLSEAPAGCYLLTAKTRDSRITTKVNLGL